MIGIYIYTVKLSEACMYRAELFFWRARWLLRRPHLHYHRLKAEAAQRELSKLLSGRVGHDTWWR